MEASLFLPEDEPKTPEIVCLKQHSGESEPVYRFREDGQDSGLTMVREQGGEDGQDHTYRLIFFDWGFAEADIHYEKGVVCVEWCGQTDGLDKDQIQEAQRLLPGSIPFLAAALKVDFPEALSVVDISGQQL